MDPQLSPDISIVEVCSSATCAFSSSSSSFAAASQVNATYSACPQLGQSNSPLSRPLHGGGHLQNLSQDRYQHPNSGHAHLQQQSQQHQNPQQGERQHYVAQQQQQQPPPPQLHLALGASRGVDVACWIQTSAAATPQQQQQSTVATTPVTAAHPPTSSAVNTTRPCQTTSVQQQQQQQHVWHLQPHQQVHNHLLASAPLSHRSRDETRHCSTGEGPPKFPHLVPFPPHGANNGCYPPSDGSWGATARTHVTVPASGREVLRTCPPLLVEVARWTVGPEQLSPTSLVAQGFGGQSASFPASVRSEPQQASSELPFGKGGGGGSVTPSAGLGQGLNPALRAKGSYFCVGQVGSGGAVAMTTSQPSNASEWQLYNVLKRANLLQYYDTFIAQGGDDVQQLCEAGEDEFLEIMALVGMAAKPLHVRRLQKALQEWVANPAALEANASAGYPVVPLTGPAPGSISAVVRDCVNLQTHPPQTSQAIVSATTWTPQPPPAPRSISPSESIPSPSSVSIGPDGKEDRGSSPMLQPVLMDSQIKAIAMAASALAKQLPYFEPKDLNAKKPINREIQNLMTSQDDHPNRIEELRKYAAIYGRFDSKRKNDRPMSLHEISVNEAAAQLCLHCPALLTRREDLFPLARQVVRDSGYQYSKGHSRAADVVVSTKKARLDPVFQRHLDASFKQVKQEYDKDSREERMSAVAQELASIRQHQEQVRAELATAREEQDFLQTQKLQSELASLTTQQLQVLQEHSDLLRQPHHRHNRSGFSKQGDSSDQNKDDPSAASGSSSPISDSNDGFNPFSTAPLESLYAAIHNSNGTLFEEGLRIAQQYGMADFAKELKELQQQRHTNSPEDSGVGGVIGVKELDQPFELREIKSEVDSVADPEVISDESSHPSADGSVVSKRETTSKRSTSLSPSMITENGVQATLTQPSRSASASPSKSRGEKPELKRKAENLEVLPTRPPSRRSRSNHASGLCGSMA